MLGSEVGVCLKGMDIQHASPSKIAALHRLDRECSSPFGAGKSQWFWGVDAEQATLDAALYADQHGLWEAGKAKVPVTNGDVGVHAVTGEPTNWINVYRDSLGRVHGAPGGPG